MSRGIVTLAVGKRRYLEMAVDMALSSSEYSRLPVSLVADEKLGAVARADFAGVFDRIVQVPARFQVHRAVKYGVVEASPYEHSLFIDADCWVLKDPEELFALPSETVMAFHGEMHGADSKEIHHGFRVSAMIARHRLDSYLKCNSGVFYFKRSRALEVMEEALNCYQDEVRPAYKLGFLGDELGIGIVGGRRGLSTFPAPGPMFWPGEFSQIDVDAPTKPVLHIIGEIPAPILDALIQRSAEKREIAGVPAGAGDHSRWKHDRGIRSRTITKLLEPLTRLMNRS